MKLGKSDLTDAEFIGVFKSDLIDLYDNDSYTNYSTTKSIFGLDLLGNNTWTGLNQISDTETESGFIESGRFIDTSGRINITGHKIVITNQDGTGSLGSSLSIFSTDDIDSEFPDDFSSTENIVNINAAVVDADRYAIFEVVIDTEESLDNIDFDLYIEIAIDAPVMAPFYDSTRRMSYKFPEWSDFNVDSGFAADSELATPAYLYTDPLATPNYVGTSVLNALAGRWLDEIQGLIKKYGVEQYINTADVNQKYKTFQTDVANIPYLVRIEGNGIEVPRVASMFDFYQLDDDEDGVYIDKVDQKLYSNIAYQDLYDTETWPNDGDPDVVDTDLTWNFTNGDSYEIVDGKLVTSYNGFTIGTVEYEPGEIKSVSIDVDIVPAAGPLRAQILLSLNMIQSEPSFDGQLGIIDGGVLPSELAPPGTTLAFVAGVIDDGTITLEVIDYSTSVDSGELDDLADEWAASVESVSLVYNEDTQNVSLLVNDEVKITSAPGSSVSPDTFVAPGFGLLSGQSVDTVRFGFVDTLAFIGINDNQMAQLEVPVWNWFDEFGMMVDLYRISGEDNQRFKQRILDVYRNKPGVTMVKFKNALRRELDLWYEVGSTPNSNMGGATPDIFEIHDIENMVDLATPYMSYDSMPTERFEDLASTLIDQYPILWGHFKYGHAFWDSTGANNEAIKYLPHRYDATPVTDGYVPGIGDGDDLYVYKPGVVLGPVEFDVDIEVRGKKKVFREEFPRLSLNVEVRGVANRYVYDDVDIDTECYLQFTVLSDDATPVEETYTYNFSLTTQSDIYFDQATPSYNSLASPNKISSNGLFEVGEILYNSAGEEVIVTEDNLDLFNLDSNLAPLTDIIFGIGYYDVGIMDVVNVIPSDDLRVGWIDEPVYDIPAATYTITRDSGISATPDPGLTGFSLPVLANYEKESELGLWKSPPMPYTINLNGLAPNETELDYEFFFNDIAWPAFLDSPANKHWEITVTSTDGFPDNPSAWYLGSDNTFKYLPISTISVDGDSTWTDGVKDIAYGTESVTFSSGTNVSPPYPEPDTLASTWEYFSEVKELAAEGVLDENSVWRRGTPPYPGTTSTLVDVLTFTREDFGLDTDNNTVITWVGVRTNNNLIDVWTDTNTVKSEAFVSDTNIDYGTNFVNELHDDDDDTYYLDRVVIRARLKKDPDPHWYPQVHAGYAYIDGGERYLYVEPSNETLAGATPGFTLGGVARQGAPVIVRTDEATPRYLRQVAFHSASPTTLDFTNEETVKGSGTYGLYVAYKDIYDIVVMNTTDAIELDLVSDSTETNFIATVEKTDRDKDYLVTYKVEDSFYVDNNNYDNDLHRSYVVLDKSPDEYGSDLKLTYETSKFYPATPVSVPLNPFYTTVNEGFIYVTTNEYDLSTVEVRVSPGNIIADVNEFNLITFKTYDEFGNPKENVELELSIDFGTLTETSLVTDADGFASTILEAEDTAPISYVATLEIAGMDDVEIAVVPQKETTHSLTALPTLDSVQADGESYVSVIGVVRDPDALPAPYSVIRYRKGRTIYSVFNQSVPTVVIPEMATPVWGDNGLVIADQYGRFEIGPFASATPDDPGYWFVAVESRGATPFSGGATPGTDTYQSHELVGDVVYWYEYPEVLYGVETISSQPKQAANFSAADAATPISATPVFPSTYDPDSDIEALGSTIEWVPPQWYAINRYKQYQYGLLGDTPNVVDYSDADSFHPDYKEF